MASAKTAADSVLNVNAGRLVFWGRVKIFREAGWGGRCSGCGCVFPILFHKDLPIKGAFTGIALRG